MSTAAKSRFIGNPTFEILLVVFCAVAIEWIILPFTKNPFVIAIPAVAIFLAILLSHIKAGETPFVVGWHFRNFLSALKSLVLPSIVFCAILISAGWLQDSLRFEIVLQWSFLKKCLVVFIGAAIQQHILQAFFNRRAERIWGRGRVSILMAALIFSLLHLPNFWLTIFTFVGGLVWVRLYQRSPNLIALTISHWFLSLVMYLSISSQALHGGRVGYNYFGYGG